MRRLCILLALGLASCIAGCTVAEVKPVDVSGEVTLDGKPLAEGEIYFLTVGMPPEILPVRGGQFSGQVKPGSRRVEVYAYREGELPPTATMMAEPPRENYIPARYNSASELKVEVLPSGANQFEFPLNSE